MLLIPIQPLTITIPMQPTRTAVNIQINTFHVNADGSGTLDFGLLDSTGATVFSAGTPTTYAQVKTAGIDLGALVPALQTILLTGLNATHA